jgi:hypothetical protein
MTTVATGQVLLAGTSPAGLAASFAAPSGLTVIRPELRRGQENVQESRLSVFDRLACHEPIEMDS